MYKHVVCVEIVSLKIPRRTDKTEIRPFMIDRTNTGGKSPKSEEMWKI